MADIYQNASLTIAAAAAKDDEGGLFRIRPSKILRLDTSALEKFNIRDVIYVRKDFHSGSDGRLKVSSNRHRQHNRLLTRAWVLQERLLSLRIVYFGKRELIGNACNALRVNVSHNSTDISTRLLI